MQVKKNELAESILNAAQEEFLNKGYEDSSLRVIARKANTTLGNIYHYFPSKEALLIAVCTPAVEAMEMIATQHLDKHEQVQSMEELKLAFEEVEMHIDDSELRFLLDKRLLILLDLKSSSLYTVKEMYLQKFRYHLRWHLQLNADDDHYVDLILQMFLECIRHVLKEQPDPATAKAEFLKVFKMLCSGIVKE